MCSPLNSVATDVVHGGAGSAALDPKVVMACRDEHEDVMLCLKSFQVHFLLFPKHLEGNIFIEDWQRIG